MSPVLQKQLNSLSKSLWIQRNHLKTKEMRTPPLYANHDLNHFSILYVEDEAITRKELSRFLKRRTFNVQVAEDGLTALSLFEENPPDILITDLRMPEMDGLTLAKSMRNKGFNGPIIITSALSDANTILEAVDRGIVKYIVKPIDVDILEETLLSISQNLRSQIQASSARVQIDTDICSEAEKILSREFSALLKRATGKGPRRLRVKIESDEIKVDIDGMLTPLEQTLFHGAQSPEALEINRRLLYETLSSQLCALSKQALGHPVRFSQYCGHIRKNQESFILKITLFSEII